ncbi:MAG: hypothetical protein ACPL4H_07425, partial [Anaerolineales bacterium]
MCRLLQSQRTLLRNDNGRANAGKPSLRRCADCFSRSERSFAMTTGGRSQGSHLYADAQIAS